MFQVLGIRLLLHRPPLHLQDWNSYYESHDSHCRLMWHALLTVVFPEFSGEFWHQTSKHFKKRANFPNCIGAVDGKHVRIIKPEHSGSMYINYKYFHSVVLLAVVDTNYKFIYTDVGSFGKEADSTIYQNSSFNTALGKGSLNIQKPERVTENLRPLPYVFISDKAFGISINMTRPYPDTNLTKS